MSSGNKDLFEQGLKNRREVVGEQYVDQALKNGSSEFAFPGQQLVTEYGSIPKTIFFLFEAPTDNFQRWCWGNIWSRPGLERKQRSLLSESPAYLRCKIRC